MSKNSKSKGASSSKLVIVLYVIAAIMAAMFIYATITSIQYIISYAASYGVTAAAMMGQGIQYVLTSSISYLAYAVIIFAGAKVLAAVKCTASADTPVEAAEAPAALTAAKSDVKEATEKPAEDNGTAKDDSATQDDSAAKDDMAAENNSAAEAEEEAKEDESDESEEKASHK